MQIFCKITQSSWGNTILLWKNANVLWVNTKFLEGMKYLCKIIFSIIGAPYNWPIRMKYSRDPCNKVLQLQFSASFFLKLLHKKKKSKIAFKKGNMYLYIKLNEHIKMFVLQVHNNEYIIHNKNSDENLHCHKCLSAYCSDLLLFLLVWKKQHSLFWQKSLETIPILSLLCISLGSLISLLMTQIALHSVSGGGNEICNGTAGLWTILDAWDESLQLQDLQLLNQNNTSQALPCWSLLNTV